MKTKNQIKNKPEIKAVIFDIGGVLLVNMDSPKFWKNVKGSKELRESFGKNEVTEKEFYEKGSKLLKISKKEFARKYDKEYITVNPLKKNIYIFKHIKTRKYILSDSNILFERKMRKEIPFLFKIAKEVFFSHRIGLRKTETKTFKLISKKINLPPQSILLIDDSIEKIQTAKKSHFRTIFLRKNTNLLIELKELD
jgi:HAD superfamily hydrolase (TIGR01509 family)